MRSEYRQSLFVHLTCLRGVHLTIIHIVIACFVCGQQGIDMCWVDMICMRPARGNTPR